MFTNHNKAFDQAVIASQTETGIAQIILPAHRSERWSMSDEPKTTARLPTIEQELTEL